MKRSVWLGVAVVAGVMVLAGNAPAVARLPWGSWFGAFGEGCSKLLGSAWGRVEPRHLLVLAAVLGGAGGVTIAASSSIFPRARTRRLLSRGATMGGIARRTGLSQDALKVLLAREDRLLPRRSDPIPFPRETHAEGGLDRRERPRPFRFGGNPFRAARTSARDGRGRRLRERASSAFARSR
jgi:hypothetical protein